MKKLIFKLSMLAGASTAAGWGGYFWSMKNFKNGHLKEGVLIGTITAIIATVLSVWGGQRAIEWTSEALINNSKKEEASA